MEQPEYTYQWSPLGYWTVKRGRFWRRASIEETAEIESWEGLDRARATDPRVRRRQ